MSALIMAKDWDPSLQSTHHFMRNISSPLLSVAPMIRSGSRFLANPRGLSACDLGDMSSETGTFTRLGHRGEDGGGGLLGVTRLLLLAVAFRLVRRCLSLHGGRLLLDALLGFQKLGDELRTVEVLLWLPGVVGTEQAERKGGGENRTQTRERLTINTVSLSVKQQSQQHGHCACRRWE